MRILAASVFIPLAASDVAPGSACRVVAATGAAGILTTGSELAEDASLCIAVAFFTQWLRLTRMARMRGSPVEWTLVVSGLLGVIGFASSDFQLSSGLLIAAGVIAIAIASWAAWAQPRPEAVYSPLQGRRRLARSPYSPIWVVFPLALGAAWVFTVYGAGTALAFATGAQHTRSGVVMYSARHEPSARSRRRTCTALTVVLETERGPKSIVHCDVHLAGNILPTGLNVTYRTRESALGLFAVRELDLPQLDSALEMAKRAEQQAARAEGRL